MIRKLVLSILIVCGLIAGAEPVLAQNAAANLSSTYGSLTALSSSTVAAGSATLRISGLIAGSSEGDGGCDFGGV